MGQIVRATNETPIERMASLRVTTKIKSSSEPQQCESYGDSRVRLWWCYPNAFRSPTADRQCAYCSFLEHNLRPALRKKRRHFLQNPPIILQDNARPHAAQAVADLFDRWGWEVLYHPPYSPDLSPCDFDLIPKMKEPLRGIRFRTVPEILQAVDRTIRTINTTGAAKGIITTSTSLATGCKQCWWLHWRTVKFQNMYLFCISCK